jgi:hypothetical protein
VSIPTDQTELREVIRAKYAAAVTVAAGATPARAGRQDPPPLPEQCKSVGLDARADATALNPNGGIHAYVSVVPMSKPAR